MATLERLKKFTQALTALTALSGIVHLYFAIGFISNLYSYFQMGFVADFDLAILYFVSLGLFGLFLLVLILAVAVRQDVSEEISYISRIISEQSRQVK